MLYFPDVLSFSNRKTLVFSLRSLGLRRKYFFTNYCFSLLAWIGVFVAVNCQEASAGASASSWVVAVNGRSENSRTLANVYCSARNIPGRNVIVLPDVPDHDLISVDQFRELILSPLIKEIEVRGLASHIQGIAYSSDFPTAIDINADIGKIENKSPYLTPVGSINGLTYLFRFVLEKNPSYLGFDSNLYAARPALLLLQPTFASLQQAQQLKEAIESSKHEDAANLLDALWSALERERQFPMQYLAAQQWAKAGNPKQAIRRIEQAIQGGWSYRDTILNDPAFASLTTDLDFRRIARRAKEDPFDYLPSRGFDARTFYAANSLPTKNRNEGMSYMMSMVLAVTRDLGITPFEAKENLRTSILADFSQPTGSFVFTKTDDVRTTTREPNFALAISKLQARGFKARVINQPLPPKGEKCSGVMIGTSDFSWHQGGATLLPGSIAENLTSLGGAMTTNSQTKATEFLRFGAAATSGAVTEPYSIQNKFPHPMIHVHYTDGLTAAEAFYSSVTCPYQLLIVGDPLCQPYAKPPRFTFLRENLVVPDNQPLQIQLKTESSPNTTEPEWLQWIVDGVLRGQAPFDPDIRMKLDQIEPGAHEIRIIAKADKPIEQSYEQSFWTTVGPPDQHIILEGPAKWRLSEGKPLTVQIRDAGAAGETKLMHDFEEVATIPAGQTSCELQPTKLGYGPVRLHASRALDASRTVRSLPLNIQLDP